MAYDAGAVELLLGGRFDRSGFAAFDRAQAGARRAASESERAIERSAAGGSRALNGLARSASGASRSIAGIGPAGRELGSIERGAKRARGGMLAMIGPGKLAAGAMTAGAFAVGKAVTSALGAAGDLERAVNVFGATTGATNAQMAKMHDLAIALGDDLTLPGTSALDAGNAMLELAKGGLSVQESMDAAKGTLQLAAAAGIDVGTAAMFTADTLNAFGLAGTDAGRVADLLAGAANASSATMPQMADALAQVSSVAKQARMPVEDTVAAITAMANAGIKGSDAGTSLKTMIQSLAAPTSEAKGQLDKMGVSVYSANGRIRPFQAIIGDLAKATKGMGDAQRNAAFDTIFGSDAIRAANVLVGQGAKGHKALVDEVSKEGSAAKLSAAQMKGYRGALEGFGSTVDTIKVRAGEVMLPLATSVLQTGAKLAGELPGVVEHVVDKLEGSSIGQRVGDAFKAAVPAARSALEGLGPALDDLGAKASAGFAELSDAAAPVIAEAKAEWPAVREALGSIGQGIVDNAPAVEAAFGSIAADAAAKWPAAKASVASFVDWWAANVAPTVAAVAGYVVAIIGALVGFLQAHWDTIKAGAEAVWSMLSSIVQANLSLLAGIVTAILAVIRGDFDGAWEAIKGGVSGFASGMLSALQTGLSTLAAVVGAALSAAIPAAGAALAALPGVVGSIVGALPGVVSAVAGAMGSAALSLGSAVVSALPGALAGLAGILGTIIGALPGLVGSFAGAMASAGLAIGIALVEAIIGALASLPGRVASMIESAAQAAASKAASIASAVLPGHADGGVVTKGELAIVGEDGPEVIIPIGAKRRARGRSLLHYAAAALGVAAFGDGGLVDGRKGKGKGKGKLRPGHWGDHGGRWWVPDRKKKSDGTWDQPHDSRGAKARERFYARLDRNVALAELTPRKADDVKAVDALRAALRADLDFAQKVHGPPALVAELARSLKGARDRLAELKRPATSTTPAPIGSPSGDADLALRQAQAQLSAERQARAASESVLASIGASGDLGLASVGSSGRAVSITVQTLHPGDSRTVRAIADATTAGVLAARAPRTPRVTR